MCSPCLESWSDTLPDERESPDFTGDQPQLLFVRSLITLNRAWRVLVDSTLWKPFLADTANKRCGDRCIIQPHSCVSQSAKDG
jgi:hypothetical protein